MELSLCHKLGFSNSYIFAKQCRRPKIFQTVNSVRSNDVSLTCQRCTPWGCKDIGIRKLDFVAKTMIIQNTEDIYKSRWNVDTYYIKKNLTSKGSFFHSLWYFLPKKLLIFLLKSFIFSNLSNKILKTLIHECLFLFAVPSHLYNNIIYPKLKTALFGIHVLLHVLDSFDIMHKCEKFGYIRDNLKILHAKVWCFHEIE